MKEPLMINAGDNISDKIRAIPNIEKIKIKGWKLVNTYFVDKSGLGQSDEPALTFNQFLEYVKINRAYAIIEEGLFQVWIGEYIRSVKK